MLRQTLANITSLMIEALNETGDDPEFLAYIYQKFEKELECLEGIITEKEEVEQRAYRKACEEIIDKWEEEIKNKSPELNQKLQSFRGGLM